MSKVAHADEQPDEGPEGCGAATHQKDWVHLAELARHDLLSSRIELPPNESSTPSAHIEDRELAKAHDAASGRHVDLVYTSFIVGDPVVVPGGLEIEAIEIGPA